MQRETKAIRVTKACTSIKPKGKNIHFTPLRISYLKLEVLIDFRLWSKIPGRTDRKPICPKSHFSPCVYIPYIVLPSLIETCSLIPTENCQMTRSAFHESVIRDVRISLKSLAAVLLHIFPMSSFSGLIITTHLTRHGFCDIISVTGLKLPWCFAQQLSQISHTNIIGVKKQKKTPCTYLLPHDRHFLFPTPQDTYEFTS